MKRMTFAEAKRLTIEKWQEVLKSGKYVNDACAFCRYTFKRSNSKTALHPNCHLCPAFKAKLCDDHNPYSDMTGLYDSNRDLLYWQIHLAQTDKAKMIPLVEELIEKLEALKR